MYIYNSVYLNVVSVGGLTTKNDDLWDFQGMSYGIWNQQWSKIGFDMIGSEIIELNGQSTSNPLKQMEKNTLGIAMGNHL